MRSRRPRSTVSVAVSSPRWRISVMCHLVVATAPDRWPAAAACRAGRGATASSGAATATYQVGNAKSDHCRRTGGQTGQDGRGPAAQRLVQSMQRIPPSARGRTVPAIRLWRHAPSTRWRAGTDERPSRPRPTVRGIPAGGAGPVLSAVCGTRDRGVSASASTLGSPAPPDARRPGAGNAPADVVAAARWACTSIFPDGWIGLRSHWVA